MSITLDIVLSVLGAIVFFVWGLLEVMSYPVTGVRYRLLSGVPLMLLSLLYVAISILSAYALPITPVLLYIFQACTIFIGLVYGVNRLLRLLRLMRLTHDVLYRIAGDSFSNSGDYSDYSDLIVSLYESGWEGGSIARSRSGGLRDNASIIDGKEFTTRKKDQGVG